MKFLLESPAQFTFGGKPGSWWLAIMKVLRTFEVQDAEQLAAMLKPHGKENSND